MSHASRSIVVLQKAHAHPNISVRCKANATRSVLTGSASNAWFYSVTFKRMKVMRNSVFSSCI
jgi:hypothetical protein